MPLFYTRRNRRPDTSARTGRRARNPKPAFLSPTLPLVPSPSARLSKIRRQSGGNPVAILNRLLKTLEENEVPGPQLFRLNREFTLCLGEGGQGNVRGISDESARQYQKMGQRIQEKWPVGLIAIKQYHRRKGWKATQQTRNPGSANLEETADEGDLCSRFRAAECEVLALSPSLFRDHPNIVQLLGWGLCLDTIEDPQSLCCGSIQTPLLVFERAEMNLQEFLQHYLFPERTYSLERLAEEGAAGSSTDRSNQPHQKTSGVATIMHRSGLKALARWTGSELHPYEIVRLLCIDIGHGLEILHHHEFTHGDLKPTNVLIFKEPTRWLAKLCDFGCAVGQATEANTRRAFEDCQPQGELYCGTPDWQPPSDEATGYHDYDGLRKCDLYVYGLVVWSSFCFRGDRPPPDSTLKVAQGGVVKLTKRTGCFDLKYGGKNWYTERINELLDSTMAKPHQRHSKPWKHLYRKHEQHTRYISYTQSSSGTNMGPAPPMPGTDISPRIFQDGKTTPLHAPRRHQGSLLRLPCRSRKVIDTKSHVQPPLTLLEKAQYNKERWWMTTLSEGQNETSATIKSYYQTSSIEPPKIVVTRPNNFVDEVDGFGPASSTELDSDSNSLAINLFKGSERRKDAQRLYLDMTETLKSWESQDSARRLYSLVRFRSRIKLDWWEVDPHRENFVDQALKVNPTVDICTLAWMCNGPIGKSEVHNLTPNEVTWRIVTDPLLLNESERLDRFLLLLQFGARVEKKFQGSRHSILSQFIESCRPATVPTVIREICRRFNEVRNSNHISPDTKGYFAELQKDSTSHTAVANVHDVDDSAALELWRQYLEPSNPPSTSLPPGWIKLGKTGHPKKSWTGFEEVLTRSITLDEPKKSLMLMREVKIGFLNKEKGDVCHLDLLPLIRRKPDLNIADVTSRFPYYNDDWFIAEWNTEPNQRDVLGMLKDPWRISTFASRVKVPRTLVKKVARPLLLLFTFIIPAGVGLSLTVCKIFGWI